MNPFPTGELLATAHSIFDYLSATDAFPPEPVDAVLGFGTFDLTLASFCGDLYAQGRVRRIVFTGGIGAGSADLGMPEADAWRQQLAATHPAIPSAHVITENRSTNTAENIVFTAALLALTDPEFAFGHGLNHALVVASPSRLRRVKLTLQQLQPALHVTRPLPPSSFAREYSLYEAKGINYLDHLAGELDRIATYPARGWIAFEALPPEISAAHEILLSR